jgi:hypothetical protein
MGPHANNANCACLVANCLPKIGSTQGAGLDFSQRIALPPRWLAVAQLPLSLRQRRKPRLERIHSKTKVYMNSIVYIVGAVVIVVVVLKVLGIF